MNKLKLKSILNEKLNIEFGKVYPDMRVNAFARTEPDVNISNTISEAIYSDGGVFETPENGTVFVEVITDANENLLIYVAIAKDKKSVKANSDVALIKMDSVGNVTIKAKTKQIDLK
jgi:hypothetical protein